MWRRWYSYLCFLMIAKIKNYCHSKHSYNNIPVRGVAKIMKKYRHKLFRRGVCVAHGVHWVKPPEARRLYNRKDDVFDHFGSAFNNMKFRLFWPFFLQYHYGLTSTLTSLTTQTYLSRTNGWSSYYIPFETVMQEGITKYMDDRGYSLNFYSSLLDTLNATNHELYPAIYSLICILLTMPV
jgi:hypothetical protein